MNYYKGYGEELEILGAITEASRQIRDFLFKKLSRLDGLLLHCRLDMLIYE